MRQKVIDNYIECATRFNRAIDCDSLITVTLPLLGMCLGVAQVLNDFNVQLSLENSDMERIDIMTLDNVKYVWVEDTGLFQKDEKYNLYVELVNDLLHEARNFNIIYPNAICQKELELLNENCLEVVKELESIGAKVVICKTILYQKFTIKINNDMYKWHESLKKFIKEVR